MRTQITTVYKFEELSEDAKRVAVDENRYTYVEDDRWWDYSYESFAEASEIFGLDIRKRRREFRGGGYKYDPSIYFSGFYSQGDGACFEGTYYYKKGAVPVLKSQFPKDSELHRIAKGLQRLQKQNFYQLTATIEHQGYYSHSGCMVINVQRADGNPLANGVEEDLAQLLRDFADWIYDCLEKEYEYLTSDEVVIECLIGNDYEFTEKGFTL